MNNNNRPTQNRPSEQIRPAIQNNPQYQNRNPIVQNPPPKKPAKTPIGLIAVQLVLLALSAAAVCMFISFLPVDITVNYQDMPLPVTAEVNFTSIPSIGIDESELPKEPEVVTLPIYDWYAPVPESREYPLDSFTNSVFIGDSRMAGLILYTRLKPLHNYTATGVNVKQLLTKPYIKVPAEDGSEQVVTCLEALDLVKEDIDAIYVSVGTNELGWQASAFAKELRGFIEQLKQTASVPIYLQLILPVTDEYSKIGNFGITNAKVTEFNNALRDLAVELKLFLLDPIDLFTLEDGTLNPEYSFDGVHLQVPACRTLATYYQTHVVDLDDYLLSDEMVDTPTNKK